MHKAGATRQKRGRQAGSRAGQAGRACGQCSVLTNPSRPRHGVLSVKEEEKNGQMDMEKRFNKKIGMH